MINGFLKFFTHSMSYFFNLPSPPKNDCKNNWETWYYYSCQSTSTNNCRLIGYSITTQMKKCFILPWTILNYMSTPIFLFMLIDWTWIFVFCITFYFCFIQIFNLWYYIIFIIFSSNVTCIFIIWYIFSC